MKTLAILLILAAAPVLTLDGIRAVSSPDRRARMAIDFATSVERTAEKSYDEGQDAVVAQCLKDMLAAIELARESLIATGKNPLRSPGSFKYGEQRTHDLLIRLGAFSRKMDGTEREALEAPISRIQQIHDDWLTGILEKKR